MNVNKDERNVIVAHQNIQNAERCESEEIIIGTVDAVSDEVFADFTEQLKNVKDVNKYFMLHFFLPQ